MKIHDIGTSVFAILSNLSAVELPADPVSFFKLDPVGPRDVFAGEVTDTEMRLLTLAQLAMNEAAELAEAIKFAGSNESYRAAIKSQHAMSDLAATLGKIAWTEVRGRLELYNTNGSITLRDSLHVVTIPPTDCGCGQGEMCGLNLVSGLFSGLMGGGRVRIHL